MKSSLSSYKEILDTAWSEHLAPRTADAPTVISTFAGGGGSSLGYSMAGFRELLAVEWDGNAVQVLKKNFPGLDVYHGDIAKLSVDEALSRTGLKPGELDVFDGSPPCQGFSTAGKRAIDDDRNQLFREFVRLLRGLKPRAFVMENVVGMVRGKMRLVFVDILKELKISGYNVSARLLNTQFFQVPQSRQRMIFIGARNDLGAPPSHPSSMGDLNSIVKGNEIVESLRNVRFLTWRNAGKRDTLAPLGAFPGGTTKSGITLEGRKTYRDPDGVKLFFSFPPLYQFTGTTQDQLNRIGNSVPPLLMRAVAKHIRKKILK